MTKKLSDIEIIVAKNLKIARQLNGLTLKDVGNILGITGQQAQKYEVGKNAISIDKLDMLAKHLNLPINFFFEKFELDKKLY